MARLTLFLMHFFLRLKNDVIVFIYPLLTSLREFAFGWLQLPFSTDVREVLYLFESVSDVLSFLATAVIRRSWRTH